MSHQVPVRDLARRGLVGLARCYQATLSPDHGLVGRLRRRPFCPLTPSCSEYAVGALLTRPLKEAMREIAVRLHSCHQANPSQFPVGGA